MQPLAGSACVCWGFSEGGLCYDLCVCVCVHTQAHANQHRDLARRAAVVATMRPGRPPWLGSMQRGWLRLLYLVSDNARHALILLVFGFKVCQATCKATTHLLA